MILWAKASLRTLVSCLATWGIFVTRHGAYASEYLSLKQGVPLNIVLTLEASLFHYLLPFCKPLLRLVLAGVCPLV